MVSVAAAPPTTTSCAPNVLEPIKFAKLTLDDVVDDVDQVRLRLGTTAVLLPDPVAELLGTFLADPRYRRNTATNHNSRWLFPGNRPEGPYTSTASG